MNTKKLSLVWFLVCLSCAIFVGALTGQATIEFFLSGAALACLLVLTAYALHRILP